MRTKKLARVVLALALAAGASGLLLRAADPQNVGEWAAAGAVADARSATASAVLADGTTIVLGGRDGDGTATTAVTVYDPVTNGVTTIGQLSAARVGHTASLLADGRIAVIGGSIDDVPTADIEIFDPATGSSTFGGQLPQARSRHAAATLADGRVLVVGGNTPNADGTGLDVLATAELYDPATGSTSPVPGTMSTGRAGASATTLLDGRVLVAGGYDQGQTDLATAEIFEADAAGAFTLLDSTLSVARSGHTAVLLPHNNSVLLAGGTSAGVAVDAADLLLPAEFPDPYSYANGALVATGSLTSARARGFGGAKGDDGLAYVAGGGVATADVYSFATIKTDKDEYAPGEKAVITGSGWQPGDVTLVFQEDPAVHDDYVLTVTADENGNIDYRDWAPDTHDFGVRFYLTARQGTTRAQATFTDAVSINITAPIFSWHRTGEVFGGFNVSVSGVYTCTSGMGANDCTEVTKIALTVSGGVVGQRDITGLSTGTDVAWGPVSLEFRTSPGPGQFTISADGKYNITALLDATNDKSDTENNFFGVDNTAPTTTIQCNGSACINPYNATVQVKLNGSDGPASTASGLASTVYCVDTTNTCVPGTAYPGGAGFNVVYSAGATYYVRYFSTDNVGNIETTHSQIIQFTGGGNTAPVANAQTVGTLEDTDVVITLTGSDADSDPLSYLISSLPTAGSLYQVLGDDVSAGAQITTVPTAVTNANHKVLFRPALDANGSPYATFGFKVNDGTEDSLQATVTVNVTPVNDEPTANGQTPVFLEDAANQLITLTGSTGPANESGQTLSFILESLPANGSLSQTSGGAVITPGSLPLTLSDATLYFTPTADYCGGDDDFTFHTMDDGGTANGGDDTSASATIDITITCVNDAPSFTIGPDQSVVVNAGPQTVDPWATNISPGPANESGQTVNFIISSNTNAGLFSAGPAVSPTGVLTFTTALNAVGSATIGVKIHDDGGTANGGVDTSDEQTFVISVHYGLCVLYDQTKAHKKGSTAPIKLSLCDAQGNNLSSAGTIVHATGLTKLDNSASATVEDSGNANQPDLDFRFDPTLGIGGGYIFNLSLKGLSTGTWKLTFSVDGVSDPSYFVVFDVR